MTKLLLATVLLCIACLTAATACDPPAPTKFNLTAISAKNGKSLFQCWQLDAPVITTTQPGVAGASQLQVGDVSNASYSRLPANYPGTPHPAPMPQFVIFLSGIVQLTIPDPPQEIFVRGDSNGIVFAADTPDLSRVGHVSSTLFEPLVGLQIPTPNGTIPPHTVLYDGGCRPNELEF